MVRCCNLGRQLAWPIALDADPMGVSVDQPTNLVDISLGENLAVIDDQNLFGDCLDFVEHMARDENRFSFTSELADVLGDFRTTERVDPGKWLVENDDVGIVGHALGQFGSLNHPLGKSAHPSPSGIAHPEALETRGRRRGGFLPWHPCEFGHVPDELKRGEFTVDALVFWTVANSCPHPRVVKWALAKDSYRAPRWFEQPADHLDQSGFARTIWAE